MSNRLFYVQISCNSTDGIVYKIKQVNAKESPQCYVFVGEITGRSRRIKKASLGIIDTMSKNVLPGAIFFHSFCLEQDIEQIKDRLLKAMQFKVSDIKRELDPYLKALDIK